MDSLKGHLYVIDDDPSMLNSLAFTLQRSGYNVHTYDSPAAFLRDMVPVSPAAILLDVRMPDMTGVQLQEELNRLGHSTPVIFLSGESQPEEIVLAMKKGAIDFLLKPFSMSDLLLAVDGALELDRKRHADLLRLMDLDALYRSLTFREKEVCSLMLKGLGNMEIAELDGTSPATVKVHRRRVLEKMRVTTLAELIAMFGRAGVPSDMAREVL